MESQLGRCEALTEAEKQFSQERARLAALEKEQREAERQAEGLGTKVAQMEAKLYRGSVRNPRELQSLQKDVEHPKARLRSQEDTILEMMSQVEEVDLKAEDLVKMERR